MEAVRKAVAVWQGDLASGSGVVSSATSSQFSELPVSWPSRTEAPEGRTSPEELLAAAHAACFCMALSGNLGRAGHAPDKLETTAEVTFEQGEAGWSVARSHITVRGWVPGMTAQDFDSAAEAAKDGCPISRALKGNVALSVDATLEA
jgi:lipoyl-dependent peroxiredoxin